MTRFDEFMCGLDMILDELRLEIRAFVPGNAEPFQAFNDPTDRFLGRPLRVSVLNPQDQLAACLLSKKPVEYGCPGTADMKISGRARRKAGSNLFHVLICPLSDNAL